MLSLPTLLFFSMCWAILGLCLSMWILECCIYKTVCWELSWYCIESSIKLGRTDNNTEFFIPCPWNISPLFIFYFFFEGFNSFTYRSCTYFVRFISKYFIWGDLLCTAGIYRKTTDFCLLTLYFETLLYWHISSRRVFFYWFFGTFHIGIHGFGE